MWVGNIKEAKKLLKKMLEDESIVPHAQTYHAIVNEWCKAGHIEEARDITNMFEAWGWRPDVFTYAKLIDGMCQINMLKEVVELFFTLISGGRAPPETETYIAFIKGFLGSGDLIGAVDFIIEVETHYDVPAGVHLHKLLLDLVRGVHGLKEEWQAWAEGVREAFKAGKLWWYMDQKMRKRK